MMGDNRRMIFNDTSKLRDTVLLRMGELQLTAEQVATLAEISPESLRRITSGVTLTPRLDVFLRVMDALEMDVKVDARID